MTQVHAALITLADAGRNVLRPGSLIRLLGAEAWESVLVGFDGETHPNMLNLKNKRDLPTPHRACCIRADYPKKTKSIAQIGILQCLKETAE